MAQHLLRPTLPLYSIQMENLAIRLLMVIFLQYLTSTRTPSADDVSLTYLTLPGKLLSRSMKIAHALLNRTFTTKNSSGGPLAGDNSIKPGDRVALVYPNNDPINFICAFYGCLQAGVVPVPIEVPLTRRDAGLQQVGFLLGSCSVQYALTSEACLKGRRLGYASRF